MLRILGELLYRMFIFAAMGLMLFFFLFYDSVALTSEQSFYGISAILLFLFWREMEGK